LETKAPLPSEPVLGELGELETEAITLNIGPQHPSTHGVFRMKVQLQGETVVDLEPVLGYLHRCQERSPRGIRTCNRFPTPTGWITSAP